MTTTEKKQEEKNCALINNIFMIPEGMQNGRIMRDPVGVVPQAIFSRCIKNECKFWDNDLGECKFVLAMDKLIGKIDWEK